MTELKENKVLIVGGGLGGLILANGLQKHGTNQINVQVFERDQTPDTRSQGYIIGLKPNGIEAIKESVSEEKFTRIEKLFKPGQFVISDRNLNVLMNLSSGNTINRGELRKILMEGIDIKFGKRLRTYEENEHGVSATFEDNTSVEGDILVGADGVKSAVRQKKIPDFKFANVNVYRIQALIPNVDAEIFKAIFPTENGIIIKTLGNVKNTIIFGRIKTFQEAISFGLEKEEDDEEIDEDEQEEAQKSGEMILVNYEWRPEPNTPLPQSKEQLLECMRKGTQSFNPLVIKLFNELAKPEHLIETKPVELTQAEPYAKQPTSRVTLLGDSAHAMTSHAGIGANTAMKSASDLAHTLVDIFINKKPFIETLEAYEKQMITRGFQAIDISRSNTERMHSSNVGVIGEAIRNTMMKFIVKLVDWGVIKLPN
ncbi:hypothetical protein PPL_03570 [Heterostelium album PN500]|uniref:FAD-binding domain-containing protein n=1 Tax=Heterostelium pallidum (strain ATCC 26659 / Pp 5 / PN500) TaxID=670386 RepID=D3B559_HETP5|nr:hypothetical protein PPL_03570 [Heterostelium album PN500]EFA83424.1 hypothetical protein PPL_03570 [Heterostelium album PN500]|eukprot:XP_020435541.1 hypothetical protein PPL_03570 [Heterostelium album PN500]